MTRAQRRAVRNYKKRRRYGWVTATPVHENRRKECRFGPPDPATVRKQQQSARNKKIKVTLATTGGGDD